MTDEKKDSLDFGDLDDVLSEWEADVDRGRAVRPESAPMPQHGARPQGASKPAAGGGPEPRALYRPMSAEDAKAIAARATTSKAPSPVDFSIDFDDDEDGATRIGQIPTELIAALRSQGGAPPMPAPATHPVAEPVEVSRSERATLPPTQGERPSYTSLVPDDETEADFFATIGVKSKARPLSEPPAEDVDLDAFLSSPPPPPELAVAPIEAALARLPATSPGEPRPKIPPLARRPEERTPAVPPLAEPRHDEPTIAAPRSADAPPRFLPGPPSAFDLDELARPTLEGLLPAVDELPTRPGAPLPISLDAKPERALALDDEPSVEAGDDHVIDVDDEDEPAVEAGDDHVIEVDDEDEPSVEAGDDHVIDVDDEDEPSVEAGDAAVLEIDDDEPEIASGDDQVLEVDDEPRAAARKPVAARPAASTGERLPLVGRSPDAQRSRLDMLLGLADHAKGHERAELLVAAAEIAESLGDASAVDHCRAAREADPKHVVALRMLRRSALARGDHAEAAKLLEAEAAMPLSPDEKALVLSLLTEVQLHGLRDSGAAEKTARLAWSGNRKSPVAALLLAEVQIARGHELEALATLERAADSFGDARAKAAVLVAVARSAEQSGQAKRAGELYSAASAADPASVTAELGTVRTHRGDASPDAAISALSRIESLLETPALVEAVRRARANLLVHFAKRPGDAAAALEGSRSVPALRTRAEAARDAGAPGVELDAVTAWAKASSGTERALACLRMAELRAEGGDLESADEALRQAQLADPKLGLVRVVREVLARRANDPRRLASATLDESGGTEARALGALGATARFAGSTGHLAEERKLLEAAVTQPSATTTADVLGFDVAAAMGDIEATREALVRDAERLDEDGRLGVQLALAFLAGLFEDEESIEAHLRTARKLAPDEPAVLRALARHVAANAPMEAATLHLEEARGSIGDRSAFAATAAARHLMRTGKDAMPALREALDAAPAYAPAAWAVERIARQKGDLETKREMLERLADIAADPRERAARMAQTVDGNSADPTRIETVLLTALSLAPDDPVLLDRVASSSAVSPRERVNAVDALAAQSEGTLRRAFALRAALLLGVAGDEAAAAARYRAILEESPDDGLVRHARELSELAAGELARIADRRLAAVRAAEDDTSRARAMVALERLDREERGDVSGAALTARALLESAPSHVPSLRLVERHAMERDDHEQLAEVETGLARHVADLDDAAAHARMAVRLHRSLLPESQEAADEVLREFHHRGTRHPKLLQTTLGMGVATSDAVVARDVLEKLLEAATEPHVRVVLALRLAERIETLDGPGPAARLLKTAVDAAPEHATAAESLGGYLERAGDAHSAAEAYELAAQNARVPGRTASLWYRAGILWHDRARNFDRALACFENVVAIDVAHLDVFERAADILRRRERHEKLLGLYDARIAAGGEPSALAAWHSQRAVVAEQAGDKSGARESLRRGLESAPDDVQMLRRYAELCLEDGDHRPAAESLIRIARLRQDREELRWVFATLGDIYDRHLPDTKRAEAAFRRVLQLVPTDREALDRLVTLLLRTGQMDPAVEALEALAKLSPPDPRVGPHRLAVAAAYERLGDARRAEGTLELMRRERPTDTVVVGALAEFYQRQGAQSALGMHLNRAAADYRKSLEEKPTEDRLWRGLVAVHELRGRKDAARCTAAAASAFGIVDAELSRLLDASGNVVGAGRAAASPELEDLLAPRLVTPAARAVAKLSSEVFEKVLPFDAKTWRAEKIGGKDHPLRQEVLRVAQWFGISEVNVLVTGAAPRICVPVSDSPVTIVVGRELPSALNEAERTFLWVRALKIAASGWSVALRTQPAQLAMALTALVHAFDSTYVPDGTDQAALEAMTKSIVKHLGRKAKSDLGPLAVEMGGRPGFDGSRMGLAVAELGDRTALLATGAPTAALSALLKLGGKDVPDHAPASARSQLLRAMPEAWALLHFAISDPHFEARHVAGIPS